MEDPVVVFAADHLLTGRRQLLYCKDSVDLTDVVLPLVIQSVLDHLHPELENENWVVSAEYASIPVDGIEFKFPEWLKTVAEKMDGHNRQSPERVASENVEFEKNGIDGNDSKSPPRKKTHTQSTPKKGIETRRSLEGQFENITQITKPSNFVRVKGLPEEYEEDILLYEINKALWGASFCDDKLKPACKVLNKEKTEATVELISVEATSGLCGLLGVEYEGEKLVLVHLQEDLGAPSPPSVYFSDRVTVHCLPEDFSEEILLYELNRSLCKSHPNKYMCPMKPAVGVIRKGLTEATVQFSSIQAAKDICCLQTPIEYGTDILFVEQVEERYHTSRQLIPTNKVNISGLPVDFDDRILLYEVNVCLWKADKFSKKVKPASKVVSRGTTEATLELMSVDAAAALCELPGIFYATNSLHVQQVQEESDNNYPMTVSNEDVPSTYAQDFGAFGFEEPPETEVKDNENLKKSCHCVIKNLPIALDKNDLEEFLNRVMVEKGYAVKDDDVIEKSHTAKNSLLVKFTCSEYASLASQLEIEYRSKFLVIQKIVVHENDSGDESCVLLDDSAEDQETYSSLEDKRGTDVFLKLLVRYRDDFPKSGSFDPFYETFRPILKRFNVCATVAQMRTRRASLRNQYRINKRVEKISHDLYQVESVIFDNKPKSLLEKTRFKWTDEDEELLQKNDDTNPEDKRLQDLIRFSEAASWTNNSSKALVQACIENKEDYDKPIRRPQFWRTISNLLYRQSYVYGPEKCSSKMEQLNCEYLNYCRDAERTGAPGPLELIKDPTTQELMSLMHELKCTDVTVNPKRVLGAGVATLFKEPREGVMQSLKEIPQTGGRTRPSVLKRNNGVNLTPAERKSRAEEKRADALFRIAQGFVSGSSGDD